MRYRGHIRDGRITFDEPARLPEGAAVSVEVAEQGVRISRPLQRVKIREFEPIRIPGDSLADELVRDRR